MRALPTTDRGRASRSRIIDAACELFYRQGVAATGLQDVIAASGTGKGQLYFFFEDKADLILAVIAAQIERVLDPEGDELGRIHTGADLRAWGDDVIAAHREHGPARCPLGSLVVELAATNPEARTALDAGFARWRDAIAAALVRVQDNADIDPGADPADLAETMLCAYEGGIVLAEVRGSVRPLELAIGTTIDAVLALPR